MTISGNYSSPVSVNGYQCWNCTDVDYAKKHIDPKHPKAGPYGIDAANDPSLRHDPKAVLLDGRLAGQADSANQASSGSDTPQGPGAQLDITV